jgi:hypothetical protein
MKNCIKQVTAVFFIVCLSAPFLTLAATQNEKHPALLGALQDLRTARWVIQHRGGDSAVKGQEESAVSHIVAAIDEIKKAAIDDGKNIDDHNFGDALGEKTMTLHKALELLNKAKANIEQGENDPDAAEVKKNSLQHIGMAKEALEAGIKDVEERK